MTSIVEKSRIERTATTRTAKERDMSTPATNQPSKTIARIVGALFLIATAMYIVGSGMLEPITTAPDFLRQVFEHQSLVVTGALMKFVTAAANVTIGILLFTILKAHCEAIALSYVVTRVFDGVGVLLAGTGTLALVALSQQAAGASAADAASLHALGTLVVTHGQLIFDVTMIALAVGGMPFCWLLYRSRLIPRALAALGFVGYASLLAGGVVQLFGLDLAMMHYVPGGIFEAALPFWLFVKGFNARAVAEPAGAAATGIRTNAASAA